jgi:acylphosphatase
MAPTLRAKRFIVHGHVQGVGFRYATLRVAERYGVKGWVRNSVDGTVEIVAEGTPDSLTKLSKWLATGAAGSRVTRVDSYDARTIGTYTRFFVEY